MIVPIAQESGAGSIFFWSLCLIIGVLAMFAAVVFLKRWLKNDDVSSPGPGFTLSDLRQLVAEGKMTAEEFEKAKVAIVGTTKSAAAPKTPPKPPSNRLK